MDEMALQAMLSQHLGGAVREEKAGGRSKVRRLVRARIDAMGKKEGVQKGSGISFEEEGDSKEVWGDCMEVEDDAECRRKFEEQRKKMQK